MPPPLSKSRNRQRLSEIRKEYWKLQDAWRGVLPWPQRLALLEQMRALVAEDSALRWELSGK